MKTKGILYQEYEPTPDNPCEIKGLNLLESGEIIRKIVPIKYVNDYVRVCNENEQLKKDIKNIIRIFNKNCDELEATEEEFESLYRWENE